MRDAWDDSVVWDLRSGGPKVVTRDQVGTFFDAANVDPALEGSFEVTLVDGKKVPVRPVFGLEREYLEALPIKTVSELTWVPEAGIRFLARAIAENAGSTLLIHGVGPNHFFNADQKDRALFLVASLTRNIGNMGGTPGAYAGNYRVSMFSGLPQYISEDPFNITLDAAAPSRVRSYAKGESAHYFNYGDRPLRVGNKVFNGDTHMPTPTKMFWFANSNSLLGNIKGFYDVMHNTLPKVETIVCNEWWWTLSCEYSDVVFGVDSWGDFKHPDMAGSVSNPFVSIYPRSPLKRMFDTVADVETFAGVGRALAREIDEPRFADYWRFIQDGQTDVYLQRIVNASNTLRGYQFLEMESLAKQGQPVLMQSRTYPRIVGWEQTNESRPWYTRSGRLEFYRDEDEFIEYGENMPLHREPVDGTMFEPGVLMAAPHPLIEPAQPSQYGLDVNDLSVEVRQVRHVMRTPDEIAASRHPLRPEGYSHVLVTPKFRHACHSMGASTDTEVLIFGPFGDFYRHDKRKPWVAEGYVDLNPDDAVALGVRDSDYMWVDADPSDRPFKGWKDRPDDYHVFRWLVRARVNPSVVSGIARAWFHFHVSTHGSVEGHETRADGLARNPRTNYQAGYRYGSHQSVTRAWLRPTLMTDSMTRKDGAGQLIGKGFELDVYCADGAPKESFVKFTKAEDGGEDGTGVWYPAQQGFRPGSENKAMLRFLAGGFIEPEGSSNG